jgi:hypothetical protein
VFEAYVRVWAIWLLEEVCEEVGRARDSPLRATSSIDALSPLPALNHRIRAITLLPVPLRPLYPQDNRPIAQRPGRRAGGCYQYVLTEVSHYCGPVSANLFTNDSKRLATVKVYAAIQLCSRNYEQKPFAFQGIVDRVFKADTLPLSDVLPSFSNHH